MVHAILVLLKDSVVHAYEPSLTLLPVTKPVPVTVMTWPELVVPETAVAAGVLALYVYVQAVRLESVLASASDGKHVCVVEPVVILTTCWPAAFDDVSHTIWLEVCEMMLHVAPMVATDAAVKPVPRMVTM